MDGCDHAADRVVKQDGDTVGRPDPYGHSGKPAYESVIAFQVLPRQAGPVDDGDPVPVDLMPLDDRIRQGGGPPGRESLRPRSGIVFQQTVLQDSYSVPINYGKIRKVLEMPAASQGKIMLVGRSEGRIHFKMS